MLEKFNFPLYTLYMQFMYTAYIHTYVYCTVYVLCIMYIAAAAPASHHPRREGEGEGPFFGRARKNPQFLVFVFYRCKTSFYMFSTHFFDFLTIFCDFFDVSVLALLYCRNPPGSPQWPRKPVPNDLAVLAWW